MSEIKCEKLNLNYTYRYKYRYNIYIHIYLYNTGFCNYDCINIKCYYCDIYMKYVNTYVNVVGTCVICIEGSYCFLLKLNLKVIPSTYLQLFVNW